MLAHACTCLQMLAHTCTCLHFDMMHILQVTRPQKMMVLTSFYPYHYHACRTMSLPLSPTGSTNPWNWSNVSQTLLKRVTILIRKPFHYVRRSILQHGLFDCQSPKDKMCHSHEVQRESTPSLIHHCKYPLQLSLFFFLFLVGLRMLPRSRH